MGFGLINKKGSKFEMIMMDVLIMNKIKDHYRKLQKIFAKTLAIINTYNPDEITQELTIAATVQRDIPITE